MHAQANVLEALVTEHGFPIGQAWGDAMQGWVVSVQGNVNVGIDQLGKGLASFQAREFGSFRPYFLSLLAATHGMAEQAEARLRVVAEALALGVETGEGFTEAELHRLQGELLLSAECGMRNAECGINP